MALAEQLETDLDTLPSAEIEFLSNEQSEDLDEVNIYDEYISKLLSKMTLKEKIGQMAQVDISKLTIQDPNNENSQIISPELARYYIQDLGVGSILNVPLSISRPWNATEWRSNLLSLHQISLENSYNVNNSNPLDQEQRIFIPFIYGLDSIHGANFVHGAILSPQPINIASTFQTRNAMKAGKLASRDTRAAGIPWLFAPILGISLNSRWPRVYETFGEDPHLVTSMGVAMIQGIQQMNEWNLPNHREKTIPSRAAACAKHFIGYSMPHSGHDRSPAWIPPRHLYQYFVPSFRQAICKKSYKNTTKKFGRVSCGNVMTVMESYSEYDGVPLASNRNAIQNLLRHQLHFDGMLVTDFAEIFNLHTWHKVASNSNDATKLFLQETSIDMSMVPFDIEDFIQSMTNQVKNGSINESRIDESVRRILKLKLSLGLFDEVPQFQMKDINVKKVGNTIDRKEMLQMSRESIILVKNSNEALPIRMEDNSQEIEKNDPISIFVTGPTMNSIRYQSGGWTLSWQGPDKTDSSFTYGTTVLDAFLQQSQTDGNMWNVSYNCGVDIQGRDCFHENNFTDKYENIKQSSIDLAATQASISDYIIVCIGESNYAEKPGDSRTEYLPQGQYELIDKLYDAVSKGKGGKIILIYFGGRPKLLDSMVEKSDAILIAFLPGPDAGSAIKDIIDGKYNPSGRLPITYPKFSDGAGSPYFHAVSEKCNTDSKRCDVEWPFGHGLSYSSYEYTKLSVSSNTIVYDPIQEKLESYDNSNEIYVSVTVTNTGKYTGFETVFFFSFDQTRRVTPEYKRLRHFERVILKPGESQVVTMSINIEDLRFIGPHDDSHLILQPGMNFQIGVGVDTICRIDETNGTRPSTCTEDIRVESTIDYIDACDAACSIWEHSGCGVEFDSFDLEKCWYMCSAESDLGWGWNYANCIDSVSAQISKSKENECWKMNTFCRNIFIDSTIHYHSNSDENTHFVLFTLLVMSVTMIFTLVFILRMERKKQKGVGELQFTPVKSNLA